MRTGTALASVVAAAIVMLGVAATTGLSRHLEIVPPVPNFGTTDRDVDTTVVAPPYGEGRPSLRELAAEADLLVGAAVEPEDMAWEPDYNLTVAREFSIITTENVLKFGLVRKTPNRYVFGPADTIVDFAAQNDLEVRGHTLVWHEEMPDWLKVQDMDREETIDLLEQHIKTVVGRYKGRIQYWDVLNEAIDWDGSLRDTIWLEKIGPEYIDMVFEWAHEADPDAKLYYNDYGIEGLNDKSDAVYELVQGMLDRGVPLHGIGLQGHFYLEDLPGTTEVAENIARFGELGLDVQFTEVDVRLDEPVTAEKLQTQADVYWLMFQVCVEQPACKAFITWGVTDKHHWLNSQEGVAPGLLFDDELQPKPAYWAIRDVLERYLKIESYAVD